MWSKSTSDKFSKNLNKDSSLISTFLLVVCKQEKFKKLNLLYLNLRTYLVSKYPKFTVTVHR